MLPKGNRKTEKIKKIRGSPRASFAKYLYGYLACGWIII